MSDPDLEKNDILSTQYKLAIVTVIHVTTWEARASISVVWPRETSDVPTSLYKAPLEFLRPPESFHPSAESTANWFDSAGGLTEGFFFRLKF